MYKKIVLVSIITMACAAESPKHNNDENQFFSNIPEITAKDFEDLANLNVSFAEEDAWALYKENASFAQENEWNFDKENKKDLKELLTKSYKSDGVANYVYRKIKRCLKKADRSACFGAHLYLNDLYKETDNEKIKTIHYAVLKQGNDLALKRVLEVTSEKQD